MSALVLSSITDGASMSKSDLADLASKFRSGRTRKPTAVKTTGLSTALADIQARLKRNASTKALRVRPQRGRAHRRAWPRRRRRPAWSPTTWSASGPTTCRKCSRHWTERRLEPTDALIAAAAGEHGGPAVVHGDVFDPLVEVLAFESVRLAAS